MPGPLPLAGELAALLSSLLWAGAFLGFSRLGRPVPAAAINLGKNATASACFAAALLLWTGTAWPGGFSATAVALFVASGVVGLTLCDTLLFRAMGSIGPQRTTLLMLGAVPVTALAALLPPWNEAALAPHRWAGIGACLLGVWLCATERHADAELRRAGRAGLVFGLLAALFQAGGVLLARWGFRVHGGGALRDAAEAAALRLYAGTLGLVVLALAVRRTRAWVGSLGQPGVFARLAPAAFFGTFLGIWANQAGLSWSTHAGVATTLNQLAPVWLIPLTTVFLGERHGLRSWGATLLAVGGVVLISLV